MVTNKQSRLGEFVQYTSSENLNAYSTILFIWRHSGMSSKDNGMFIVNYNRPACVSLHIYHATNGQCYMYFIVFSEEL